MTDPLIVGDPQLLQQARAMAAHFLDQPPQAVEPLGNGLINATFRLTVGERGYILQRLNPRVFAEPTRIIDNYVRLVDHLARGGGQAPAIPALIRARDGRAYALDAAGHCWRLLAEIPRSRTLPRLVNAAQARAVGAILGGFHQAVAGLPVDRLALVLPGFHETPRYLERLLARLDAVAGYPQEPEVVVCRDALLRRAARVGRLETACRAGAIALRPTHGDPKLDNILFAADDDRALALIDLDTLQPGLILHDIADCLRSCCNRHGESPTAGGQPHFALDLAAVVLAGYADAAPGLLSAAEIALLHEAIWVIPLELGMRFLTDHLEGDRYFRVARRGENLGKAMRQFALVESIETQEAALQAQIARLFGRRRSV